MLFKFLTFIKGYLTVKVVGFSPERFLNLCTNRGIFIWNLKGYKDGYTFNISIKGFKMIRPFVKKTKTKVVIIEKIGLPFFFHKYRKRKLFFLGILIFALLLYILSLFIWKIEIKGNYTYTQDMFLKYLTHKGYTVGTFKNKVNCAQLEKMILNDFDEVAWISAEVSGTKLILNFQETLERKNIKQDNKPCDIVANKHGIISSIVTRYGTPKVVKGDVVKKGDILISSDILIKREEQLVGIKCVHSDADIYAKTVYTYEDNLNFKHQSKIYTGKTKKGYIINLFNLRLVIFHPRISYKKYDKIEKNNILKLSKDFYLPFEFISLTYKEYNHEEKYYTNSEAMTIINNKKNKFIRELEKKGVQILENNVKIVKEKNSIKAKGKIIALEKIGKNINVNTNERRQKYENEIIRENDTNTE